MNDKALYQLERAVDALKLMAEALREEQRNDTISLSTDTAGDVVFPTAWHDDVIELDKSTLHGIVTGDIEINVGTEGNITFS